MIIKWVPSIPQKLNSIFTMNHKGDFDLLVGQAINKLTNPITTTNLHSLYFRVHRKNSYRCVRCHATTLIQNRTTAYGYN